MKATANKQSKSVRILNIIASRDGMRFRDIQLELWKMTHGRKPVLDSFRGYWCTNLLGGRMYHEGLLNYYCTKGKDGLWRRNNKNHFNHPWRWMGGWRY